jgi:hypothetical protein
MSRWTPAYEDRVWTALYWIVRLCLGEHIAALAGTHLALALPCLFA